MKDGDLIDTKKRYEIKCPYCGKVQYACISILHTWGVADGGHGTCLECKGFMRLLFDYEAETMTAEKWEVKKHGEMSSMRKESVGDGGSLPGLSTNGSS